MQGQRTLVYATLFTFTDTCLPTRTNVFTRADGQPAFQPVVAPTPEELARLIERIALRVMKLLTRHSHLVEEAGIAMLQEDKPDEVMVHCTRQRVVTA